MTIIGENISFEIDREEKTGVIIDKIRVYGHEGSIPTKYVVKLDSNEVEIIDPRWIKRML